MLKLLSEDLNFDLTERNEIGSQISILLQVKFNFLFLDYRQFPGGFIEKLLRCM